jgi:ArsR family transcriptional regulator
MSIGRCYGLPIDIHAYRFIDVESATSLMRLLGDDVRLRLLRVLGTEALNVSELTSVLGIAQSGVSRHLGLLRDAGLVTEERTGAYSWYRLAPAFDDATAPAAPLWQWLRREFARESAVTAADDARLQEVRRMRRESFADHGADAQRGQLVPGRSWAAWSRALGLLLPALDVADLGCGDGYLTVETARWARRVTAIDQSDVVLARGRALAARRKAGNITWKRGELERVPLRDGAVELVLLSQSLHHASDPDAALREAHRILKPGGRVLVLDLRAHGQAWVRHALGDRWLGFSDDELRDRVRRAGFDDIALRVGSRTQGDPFVVLIAAATKRGDVASDRAGAGLRPPASRRRRPRGVAKPRLLEGKRR